MVLGVQEGVALAAAPGALLAVLAVISLMGTTVVNTAMMQAEWNRRDGQVTSRPWPTAGTRSGHVRMMAGFSGQRGRAGVPAGGRG